jgi:hypothetical protein
VERAANGVDADPVARAFVAEARAPAAGGFEAAIGRAADAVGAGSGDLQDSRPSLKGRVEGDDMVAHHFGALDAEIVEDRGDPLRDAGHAGAGHAAASGLDAFDAGLRKGFFQHGAQIGFRRLSAHAQSLDGSALPCAHNLAIGDNGGPCVGAAAVNSQNYAHGLSIPFLFFRRGAAVAQRSRQNIQAAIGFRRIEAQQMRHPRIQIYVIKRSNRFPDAQIRARGEETGLHLGQKARIEAVHADVGRVIWSCPAAGAWARMANGPVATTTGSPSRGFWL